MCLYYNINGKILENVNLQTIKWYKINYRQIFINIYECKFKHDFLLQTDDLNYDWESLIRYLFVGYIYNILDIY